MREELKKHIDLHYSDLTQDLDSGSGLLNRLIQREVITSAHLQEIKGEKTHRKQNEALLDILKLRDDECFDIFRDEVCKGQKQLAKECLTLPDGLLCNAVPETSRK